MVLHNQQMNFKNKKLNGACNFAFHNEPDDGSVLSEAEPIKQAHLGSLAEIPERPSCKHFRVVWNDLSCVLEKPTAGIVPNAWDKLKSATQKLSSTSASAIFSRASKSGRYDLEQASRAGKQNGVSEPAEQPKQILHQLSGSFSSGQLTGIMGPSGAGKTTLLNVLSRQKERNFTGRLSVVEEGGGHSAGCRGRIKVNAIPQRDHLHEYLTVRENLLFASRLNCRRANHEEEVLQVSALLGLNDCLDTRTSKISGGQQKRLSIGQELLTQADILTLDEPTSGLDSSNCLKTLSVLRDLAKRQSEHPVAVVLTIHQPQKEAFDMFDRIYVIADGGAAIYDGPPSGCIDYVNRHTDLRLPKPDYDPASFLLDIASGVYGPEPIAKLEQQVRLDWKRREMKRFFFIEPRESNDKAAPHKFQVDKQLVQGSGIDGGEFFYKSTVLTHRCLYSLISDPWATLGRVGFHIAIPIMLSFLFGSEAPRVNGCPNYQSEYPLGELLNSDKHISPQRFAEFELSLENVALIFMSINACLASSIGMVALISAFDMQSSMREYQNGWYSINAYLFSKIIANAPIDFILPLLNTTILFYASGQDTGSSGMSDIYRILIISSSLSLSLTIAGIFGIIIGIAYKEHITTGIFVSQCATLPSTLLGGFCTRIKNMPRFIQYISNLSAHGNTLNIAFLARFGFGVCPCDPQQFREGGPTIVGIPQDLKRFIDIWQGTQGELETNSSDLFRIIGKQVSLYNSFGVDIDSCADAKPYILADFDLKESYLVRYYLQLVLVIIISVFIMVISVNRMVRKEPAF